MRVCKAVAPVLLVAVLVLPVLLVGCAAEPAGGEPVKDVVLAIHGGEGDLPPTTPADEVAKVRKVLREALQAGYARMKAEGGTGLDGVEAAIRVMEDSGLFDAGRGSVFTHDGHNELDASIMEGKEKKAGAVASVTIVKNPISAARAVLEKSRHVLLVGRGAELFAIEHQKDCRLDIVPPSYFWNRKSWEELQDEWKKHKDPRLGRGPDGPAARPHFGTVGAVARWDGGLAAGTSTGGLTDKLPGRVGDSPIIGAGTYADNDACAVSATGIGEFFIRYAIAHDIAARVKYKHLPADKAAGEVIEQLKTLRPPEPIPDVQGVEGGVIVLDKEGNFSARYNSTQMSRGYVTRDGKVTVVLFDKNPPK
jgi:beta-aspartyl-peptidase (threonine type)